MKNLWKKIYVNVLSLRQRFQRQNLKDQFLVLPLPTPNFLYNVTWYILWKYI